MKTILANLVKLANGCAAAGTGHDHIDNSLLSACVMRNAKKKFDNPYPIRH